MTSKANNFNQPNANYALVRLSNAAFDRERNRIEAFNDKTPRASEEDSETVINPFFDSFVTNQLSSNDSLERLATLDKDQFETLFDTIEELTLCTIYSGKDQKSLKSPRKFLFMLLAIMKRGGKWSFMATMARKRACQILKTNEPYGARNCCRTKVWEIFLAPYGF